VLALPGAGARVGCLVAHEVSLADEESLAAAVATLELAVRIVPLHVVVEALAGVEALLAQRALEVRLRVVLLHVVAQIVPIAVLLAAHPAGMLLLHVAALQVHGSRSGILEAGLALRTIVRLLRIVAGVDVLQQKLLQLIALLRQQAELAGVSNGQFRRSRLPGWMWMLLGLLVDVYGIHKNLYGFTGSVWLCFG